MPETRRLVHDPKRGPEGVGANVKTKLPRPHRVAQKTSLLPRQPNRLRNLAAVVRVGQGMSTLALDPLPDVGERQVVWEES